MKRSERLEALVLRLINLNEEMDQVKIEIEAVRNELLEEELAHDKEKSA